MDRKPININPPAPSVESDPTTPSEPSSHGSPLPEQSSPGSTPPSSDSISHDFSHFDPIDNPYTPATSSVSSTTPVSTTESTSAPSAPALANTLTAPDNPRSSFKKRILLGAISLTIIVGGGILLNILGFFTQRETLACTLVNKEFAMDMDFNFANGSVDTVDFKFKFYFASPSEAERNLSSAENGFRKVISKQLTGRQDLSMDMQFYTEGNSVVADTRLSRDLLSNVSLATGAQKTRSVSEAKNYVEGQIPGVACVVK